MIGSGNMFTALRGGQMAPRGPQGRGGFGEGQMTTQMMPADGSAPVAPPPGQVATTSIPAPGVPGVSSGPATPGMGGGIKMGMFGQGGLNSPWLSALQAWRQQRPDMHGMDPAAKRDMIWSWINGRPELQGILGQGAAPVPGAVPPQGIAVGEPNPAAVSNMAPPGMVGTSLGIPGGYSY